MLGKRSPAPTRPTRRGPATPAPSCRSLAAACCFYNNPIFHGCAKARDPRRSSRGQKGLYLRRAPACPTECLRGRVRSHPRTSRAGRKRPGYGSGPTRSAWTSGSGSTRRWTRRRAGRPRALRSPSWRRPPPRPSRWATPSTSRTGSAYSSSMPKSYQTHAGPVNPRQAPFCPGRSCRRRWPGSSRCGRRSGTTPGSRRPSGGS